MKNTTNPLEENAAAETRPLAHKLEVIASLSRAYLDAGLPWEAAVKSAVADYECSVETCRSRTT